jgi:hypothetical protein
MHLDRRIRKIFLASFCLSISCTTALGQNLHVNLYGGLFNYQGDLQVKQFTFSQSHLGGGAGLSYDINNHFSIRGIALLGKVSADDKYGRNKARNLSFASKIYEAQLGVEYYITPLNEHALSPYLFVGIAAYHFSPYAYDSSGAKIYLSPLSTEGEGFVSGKNEYKGSQVAIPFGAGVKFSVTEKLNVGIEMGFRKLFTDYLDDVSGTYVDKSFLLTNRGSKAVEMAYRAGELTGGSPDYPVAGTQRGSPKNKDWYYFSSLTLSYTIGTQGTSAKKSRRKQFGCPVNVL